MESSEGNNGNHGKTKRRGSFLESLKYGALYLGIYISGIITFLLIIADPFTMSTYFSDNSLLPGLVNREFSLLTESEYYLRDLEKLVESRDNSHPTSLSTQPNVVNFIKRELDNFGLDPYEQNFSFKDQNSQYNGTNLYSIIRGERSTSSESIVLCAPFRKNDRSDTLAGVALTLSLANYFSSKSYWAKDVIIVFIDHDNFGLAAWLDSYYDVDLRTSLKGTRRDLYYESLPERSGPMQAAIVVELSGREFSKVNIKIQGNYGQLPNLDLFNLVIELSARESVTPYFHDKSLPFDLSTEDLYRHHLETALSFMKTQATMHADGLHGQFLKYSVQSLTLEAPSIDPSDKNKNLIKASLLNVGRLIEGVFRSLNNLTERFNRSYYFYIILSLRRFTSIGYYMIAFGLTIVPVLLKAYLIHQERCAHKKSISIRTIILLAASLILSLISTFNISLAMMTSVATVPILLAI